MGPSRGLPPVPARAPSARSLLLPTTFFLLTLPPADAGKGRGGFHAYWSPHHGAAVFSTWDLCSKWATGPTGSACYHKDDSVRTFIL